MTSAQKTFLALEGQPAYPSPYSQLWPSVLSITLPVGGPSSADGCIGGLCGWHHLWQRVCMYLHVTPELWVQVLLLQIHWLKVQHILLISGASSGRLRGEQAWGILVALDWLLAKGSAGSRVCFVTTVMGALHGLHIGAYCNMLLTPV